MATIGARWRAIRSHLELRPDSEHQQAFVRLAIIGIFLAYVAAMAYSDPADFRRLTAVLAVLLIETLAAVAIILAVLRDSGISAMRRWVGIGFDFGCTALILHLQGKPVAPLAALFLWMTIGNGLRFGTAYLLGTSALSAAAFGVVVATTDYWQAHLGLAVAMVLAGAAIPLSLVPVLDALQRARDDATRADASKSRFLATMSHELRTPLNGIIVAAGLLAVTKLSREQREFARAIRSAANALMATVNNVLDMTALRSGRMRMEARDFSLPSLLRGLEAQFSSMAREKRLHFAVESELSVPVALVGDRVHIRHVLANLLQNAFESTDCGGVLLSVTAPDKARVRFEVRDSGAGIPQEEQGTVFQPFELIGRRDARRYPGNCLSISVAKATSEWMGGVMTFDSTPGRGTTFHVELPLPAGSAEQAAANEPVELHDEPGISAFDATFVRHRARVPSMRLLIVDDQPANQG